MSDLTVRRLMACAVAAACLIPMMPTASAQLVIDRAWFEAQVDTTIETRRYAHAAGEQAQSIYESEFEGGTFDFSYLSVSSEDLVLETVNPSYPMPVDVPGADDEDFSSADYVTVIVDNDGSGRALETSYVYYRIDDDALVQLGWYSEFNGDLPDLKVVFQPEFKPSPIPVRYEPNAEPWVTEADQVTYVGSEEASRVRYRLTMEVEGHGTLVLPDGSHDALRVRTTLGQVGRTPSETVAFRTATNDEARLVLDDDGNIDHVTYTTRRGVTTSADRPVAGLPDGYRLDQNYPNPFNPSTRIAYEVPHSQYVRITVFDALGREVRTLVDDQVPAGSHEVTFDARDLPSGVYVYRLEAGPATATGRMVLLK